MSQRTRKVETLPPTTSYQKFLTCPGRSTNKSVNNVKSKGQPWQPLPPTGWVTPGKWCHLSVLSLPLTCPKLMEWLQGSNESLGVRYTGPLDCIWSTSAAAKLLQPAQFLLHSLSSQSFSTLVPAPGTGRLHSFSVTHCSFTCEGPQCLQGSSSPWCLTATGQSVPGDQQCCTMSDWRKRPTFLHTAALL